MRSDFLLLLNWPSSDGGVQMMLKGKHYCAVVMVLPIACDFINRVTGYTKSAKMTIVYTMFSSLLSRVLSCNWKPRWTSEELKAIGAAMREFRKGTRIFSSARTSEVYTMKFHLLNHFWRLSGYFWTYLFCMPLFMTSLTFIWRGHIEGHPGGVQHVCRR